MDTTKKGTKPEKFTPEQVAKAIENNKGVLAAAAIELKCHRHTVDHYRRKYVMVRDACREANETMKDFTEQQLYKNIAAGKEASIFFYLKCKAKERGYVESTTNYNFNIPWDKLSTSQLKRIADGEDIANILANPS
jgi:predicted glutamine amidotransferase